MGGGVSKFNSCLRRISPLNFPCGLAALEKTLVFWGYLPNGNIRNELPLRKLNISSPKLGELGSQIFIEKKGELDAAPNVVEVIIFEYFDAIFALKGCIFSALNVK